MTDPVALDSQRHLTFSETDQIRNLDDDGNDDDATSSPGKREEKKLKTKILMIALVVVLLVMKHFHFSPKLSLVMMMTMMMLVMVMMMHVHVHLCMHSMPHLGYSPERVKVSECHFLHQKLSLVLSAMRRTKKKRIERVGCELVTRLWLCFPVISVVFSGDLNSPAVRG